MKLKQRTTQANRRYNSIMDDCNWMILGGLPLVFLWLELFFYPLDEGENQ